MIGCRGECKTRTAAALKRNAATTSLKIGPDRVIAHRRWRPCHRRSESRWHVSCEIFAQQFSNRVERRRLDDSQILHHQLNRRLLLKGAAAGGAVVATQSIAGFPTVWAQNTKDVTLVHAGGSYAAIKEIGEQASKDLGFKIVMQAITDDVQLNRSLTQPNTIDINNIDSTKLPYLVGKGVLAPVPVAKYKLWSETVPLFTKGSYPNGKMASTQGLSPIEAMFYADKDGKKLGDKPSEFLTMIPTIYNADTLGIRPDLVGGRDKVTAWKDLLDPKYKGKTALVDYAPVGVMDVAMALESRGDFKYADKGNMTKEEIDKTIKIMIDHEEGRPFPLVLEHLRPVGEPDGLGRGGDPVDVVAGRHRGALARHRLLLRAAQGRLSRLVRRARADGASQRDQARLRLRVHELVQLGLAGRLHRQAGLLFGGADDGQEVPDARRNGTTGTTASPPRSTSRIPTAP